MTPKYSLIVFRDMSNDHPAGGESHTSLDSALLSILQILQTASFLWRVWAQNIYAELPKSGKFSSVSDFKFW